MLFSPQKGELGLRRFLQKFCDPPPPTGLEKSERGSGSGACQKMEAARPAARSKHRMKDSKALHVPLVVGKARRAGNVTSLAEGRLASRAAAVRPPPFP